MPLGASNTITPLPQDASVTVLSRASNTVRTDPLFKSIFFTLLSGCAVRNARKRLSGDQVSGTPPSVPANGRAAGKSKSRTQIVFLPEITATKATRRPSGETRTCPILAAPSGGGRL